MSRIARAKETQSKIHSQPCKQYRDVRDHHAQNTSAGLQLCRALGNQAMLYLSSTGIIQRKLIVGKPNGKYEQEADRIAEMVMRMPDPNQHARIQCKEDKKEKVPAKHLGDIITPIVQQHTTTTPEALSITSDIEKSVWSLKGKGHPLSKKERDFFEPRFGVDFSNVRIHTGGIAARSAKDLNAQAYTVGNDVVMGDGKYSPGNESGKKLLGHELAHFVQQNQKPAMVTLVQCWGPNDHFQLTIAGLNRVFTKSSDFELDPIMAIVLATLSTIMDIKLPELIFNIGSMAAASETKLAEDQNSGIVSQRIPRREIILNLQEHYKKNPERASHHGEGGLYSKPYSEARYINTITIKQYLDKASSGLDIFSSLGDALHIAQDRCSHGEGAIGKGHAWEVISGKDPDNRNDNPKGWGRAREETEWVLRIAAPFLRDLLDKNYIVKRMEYAAKRMESDIKGVYEIPNRLERQLSLVPKELEKMPGMAVRSIRGISDIPYRFRRL